LMLSLSLALAWRGVASASASASAWASHVTGFDFEECRGNAGRSAGVRGGKDNGGLQSRRRGSITLRSSPHPKPPTGYPREAVGDLMGLNGKMVGDPFWKPQKT
jgi:hypothetical protein